jgi:uncharacterized protein (DUF302 family)
MNEYGFVKELDANFESVVDLVREHLRDAGFGVLSSIDIKEIFAERLGIDFKRYVVLGICDPATAHKAILAQECMGLMLLCSVIIYESNERVIVEALRPTVAMQMIDNLDIKRIARDIERRLKDALESLQPVGAVP